MIFDQLDFKEEKVMDNEKIEKLQQMIDESDHICITRLINIHPRLW